MKFTLGPWEFIKGQDNKPEDLETELIWGTIKSNDDYHVARIWNDVPEAKANAQLISAAPDLYEALDDLMTALAHLVFSPDNALVSEMKAAEIALDKATGETP